jgi:bacterioferritin (cytochrome b1)
MGEPGTSRPGLNNPADDHALKAGHDYGQYVRDAENAGTQEIADFFKQVMEQDTERAHRCHEFLVQLGGTDNTSPQG